MGLGIVGLADVVFPSKDADLNMNTNGLITGRFKLSNALDTGGMTVDFSQVTC